MVVFDRILCDFVLPEANHANIEDWKTFSFEKSNELYAITEDGHLVDPEGDSSYSGQVRFFHDSKEMGHVEYLARFTDGKMTEIVEIKQGDWWRYYGTT